MGKVSLTKADGIHYKELLATYAKHLGVPKRVKPSGIVVFAESRTFFGFGPEANESDFLDMLETISKAILESKVKKPIENHLSYTLAKIKSDYIETKDKSRAISDLYICHLQGDNPPEVVFRLPGNDENIYKVRKDIMSIHHLNDGSSMTEITPLSEEYRALATSEDIAELANRSGVIIGNS